MYQSRGDYHTDTAQSVSKDVQKHTCNTTNTEIDKSVSTSSVVLFFHVNISPTLQNFTARSLPVRVTMIVVRMRMISMRVPVRVMRMIMTCNKMCRESRLRGSRHAEQQVLALFAQVNTDRLRANDRDRRRRESDRAHRRAETRTRPPS